VCLSYHQNAGQDHNVKIANKLFENVEKFDYLGMTVTKHIYIHDEIKTKLHLGNVWCHSVQNHLPSGVLA
jgi:hypothetical protein